MQKLMGSIIKHERLANNMTQRQVADKLHTSEKYVTLVENGHKNITAATFEEFLTAAGTGKSTVFHPKYDGTS